MFRHKTSFRNLCRRRKLLPSQMIVLGFLCIILLGGLLLSLPVSSASGETTPFSDALFTATSATCVTGLVVVNTATHWSLFGQSIILCLIQIGGLGFMSIAAMLSLLLRRSISFSERRNVMESLNLLEYDKVSRMLKYILYGTTAFEGAGAVILAARFIPDLGFFRGLWTGLFTSVSAFCNAGFDLMGVQTPFSSMTAYADDLVVTLTICCLIFLGGLGFLVWADLAGFRKFSKLSVFSKVVLLTSLLLILLGH